MYTDAGTSLFNEVVKNVPVLAPKFQAMVSKRACEKCLETVVGVPDEADADEAERLARVWQHDEEARGSNKPDATGLHQSQAFAAAHFKKRRLYRQESGVEVPLFPRDILSRSSRYVVANHPLVCPGLSFSNTSNGTG